MTEKLPASLYSRDQIRQLDALAAQAENIPTVHLMKRAGKAAFRALCACWPTAEHVVVMCGGGNNAGDGYVIAALAAQRKIPVTVYRVSELSALKGDAQLAYQYALQEQVAIEPFNVSNALPSGTVIVDALLGTGFNTPMRDNYAAAVQWVNESSAPVLAIDLPSGLEADTGYAEVCVKADYTITFIAMKLGLLTGKGPAVCGQIQFDDLAVDAVIYTGFAPLSHRIEFSDTRALWRQRDVDSHKGHSGHVVVCGGYAGFGGAAIMAAEASTRSGAGLTSLVTHPAHVSAALVRAPEVMTLGVENVHDLPELLSKANTIVLGPGLGQTSWSEQVFYSALQAADSNRYVIDADGLNLLARFGLEKLGLKTPNAHSGLDEQAWVLTPHPGEAARLLGVSTAEIQKDRVAAVKAIQHAFGGVVVLKGAGTLIYAGDAHPLVLANVGNEGMAVGGMGDILSGIIGALLAQGYSEYDAAILGVCLHGAAGDKQAQVIGKIGLRPTDLLPVLPNLIQQITEL